MGSLEYSWSLRLLDSIIGGWKLLDFCTIGGWTSPSRQDDSLGCEQLLKLAILLCGQQGQDLGDVRSLSCHGVDRLAEDRKLILLDQWSLDHVGNDGQFKLQR